MLFIVFIINYFIIIIIIIIYYYYYQWSASAASASMIIIMVHLSECLSACGGLHCEFPRSLLRRLQHPCAWTGGTGRGCESGLMLRNRQIPTKWLLGIFSKSTLEFQCKNIDNYRCVPPSCWFQINRFLNSDCRFCTLEGLHLWLSLTHWWAAQQPAVLFLLLVWK